MKNFLKKAFIASKDPSELSKVEWYNLLAMLYYYMFYSLATRIRNSDMEIADAYLSWGDWFRLHRHEWKHMDEGFSFYRNLSDEEQTVFLRWLRDHKQNRNDTFSAWREGKDIAPTRRSQPDHPSLT